MFSRYERYGFLAVANVTKNDNKIDNMKLFFL